MAFTFKISMRGGLIRRITFPGKPSWQVLSARIGDLYNIPPDKLAVSYVDKDGDELTLSSEEELRDFYDIETSDENQALIRFTVRDLRSLRDPQYDESLSLPHSPNRRNTIRNTFGGVFDVDDDWQLPSLGFFRQPDVTGDELPHAFLEVVESEVDVKTDPSETGTIKAFGNNSTTLEPDKELDKGKGRVYEPSITGSISTTGSVLAEDAPPKPPIHVFNVTPEEDQARPAEVQPAPPVIPIPDQKNAPTPPPAESTPKVSAQSVMNNNTSPEAATTAAGSPSPHPPVDTPAQLDTPSLTRDVAALVHALSTAISSHPEVFDNFRTIARNVTNGTYWQNHRQSIARVTDEIARQTQETTGRAAGEVRRLAEEDAGRRIAEAVGELFRQLSTVTGSGLSGSGPSDSISPPPVTAVPENPAPLPPTAATYQKSGKFPPPPPPPPLPFGSRPNSWYGVPAKPRPNSWGLNSLKPWEVAGNGARPVPPPPPRAIPSVPVPRLYHPPPLPPPPPNAPLYHPSVPIPPPLLPITEPLPDPAKMTAEELRADLEITKQRYKAEKEMYRAQREQRRKDKERTRNLFVDGNNAGGRGFYRGAEPTGVKSRKEAPVTQIVSNARGPYPELEMVSVSHTRNRSTFRHPSARTGPEAESGAIERITKRLADMGFVTDAYPSIPTRIKSQLSIHGAIGKDAEDEIVTTLLEELLAISPKPAASTSRPRRDRDIPGAWS